MPRVLFALLILFLTLRTLTPALLQLSFGFFTPFYINGVDEFVYLSYAYALESAQQFSRPGQLLVVLLHNLGLGAGWINLVFDLVLIPLQFVGAASLFRSLGLDVSSSRWASLCFLLLPSMFSLDIPITGDLFRYLIDNGHLFWITFPNFDFFLPARSPEPQFSMVVLLWALSYSIRTSSYWLLYLVAPFVYTFIAIPLLMGTIAFQVLRFSRSKHGWVWPSLIGFVSVSLLLLFYFKLFISEEARGHLTESRIPLVSFIFLVFLALIPNFNRITLIKRDQLMILSIIPLLCCNTQIISGWIAQPYNFDQYVGLYIFSFFICLFLSKQLVTRVFLILFSISVYTVPARSSVLKSSDVMKKFIPTRELLTILKESPQSLLINDLRTAQAVSMLYPKQDGTRFAYWRTQLSLAEQNIDEYLCVRKRIMSDPDLYSSFKDVLTVLDEAYAFEQKNYIFNTLLRREVKVPYHDLNREPEQCSSETLYVYTVEDNRLREF